MKTVLITGIGRGIGKALAQKFLAEGYSVIGTTHGSDTSKITGIFKSPNLKNFALDLTSPSSIKDCADKINQLGITIDILINNAGALFDNDDTKVIIEKLRQTLEVNLIGPIDFTEHMIGLIRDNGHIVNISSSAGSLYGASDLRTTHYPYHYPSYKISKVALNMYTRTLSNRFIHDGIKITVSSVHPGWVKTDMGGPEASVTPEEAAENIYKLAIERPETGQFWFKGEKYPW
ncbi:MAG: SDR family NAD(P)-dependent oxidoreductase [Candidatus Taylorbacteria bacterium]|nr:SDR family NAD(P)-dependent oxidoreductase [Candidatus Taylorbacteria bacterium]